MSRVTATQRTSEKDMLTGLKQRGARWSLRRRVPADLVEAWGQREVTRALDTPDYKEARKRLPQAWAALDAEFEAFRAELSGKGEPAPQAEKPVSQISPTVIALLNLDRFRAERDEAAQQGQLAGFMQEKRDALRLMQAMAASYLPMEASSLASSRRLTRTSCCCISGCPPTNSFRARS